MDIKMIKIIILMGVSGCLVGSCSGSKVDENTTPEAGIGGEVDEETAPPVLRDLSVFPPQVDPDQDNVPDAPLPNRPDIKVDNCPGLFNPDQADQDGDGKGDACP